MIEPGERTFSFGCDQSRGLTGKIIRFKYTKSISPLYCPLRSICLFDASSRVGSFVALSFLSLFFSSRIYPCPLSRSLYFSLFECLDVLESTCGSCFSERRISLENTREMISLRVDIANKWKTALKSLLSPYLGDSLRLCIVGDSNSVSRRVFPRSAESPVGRKCIPKKRVRKVYLLRFILFRAEILSYKCILVEHQN